MSRAIRVEYLILLFSVLMMAGYNHGLWSGIIQANDRLSLHTLLFLASCAVFLTALFNFLFNFLALKWVVKPALIVIVLSSAVASYFIDGYGVHIDTSMLQNVLETDRAEAHELFTGRFLIHLFLWGMVPAWIIGRLEIRYSKWTRQLLINVFSMLASVIVIGLIAVCFYQDYASTFRNHRDLRYLINPTSYVYAAGKIISQRFEQGQQPLIPISQQAALGYYAKNKKRRTIAVLVVGETARAESFHMNGYSRQTTPRLEQTAVLNFPHVTACGTATAISVPCMFSMFPHDDYDDAKGHGYESVLDVIAAAGEQVVWLDNNSGCKGVCDRVEHKKIIHMGLPQGCQDGDCFDEALLPALKQSVASHDGDMLVVLHQKGSHGPAYYQRVPAAFRKFEPVCETAELQDCSREQIVNAYDNTILYTDYVLSEIIGWLQTRADEENTAMLYVSDHGESLGESNFYLHGAPYLFAPQQQKQVPMLLWLSDNFEQDYRLDGQCLKARQQDELSHDNLFHSLLGMMDIQLPGKYDPDLDLFADCRSGTGA